MIYTVTNPYSDVSRKSKWLIHRSQNLHRSPLSSSLVFDPAVRFLSLKSKLQLDRSDRKKLHKIDLRIKNKNEINCNDDEQATTVYFRFSFKHNVLQMET